MKLVTNQTNVWFTNEKRKQELRITSICNKKFIFYVCYITISIATLNQSRYLQAINQHTGFTTYFALIEIVKEMVASLLDSGVTIRPITFHI